ncbi:MAG TPA: ferric reductase-like transmembrane domain-containing protein [Solirubrobacteraceae bacterium]|jgi:sulfoxide reductase heme-binding subunit YedZ|nr:ferric reductase-like transmembrane domain-containing protein [Solirubrobacteraceae bacterium]
MAIANLSGALATATGPHLYWIASRAAGSAALILSSVSVCIGLLMGGRLLKGRRLDLRVAHEALSLATLAAIAVHGLTLLGDGFLKLSLADVAVPFASGYMTFWTTAGIIAFWALLALGLSYYARARIGVQRWRMLHRFTALAWILGIAHSLGEGSDAGQAWFLAMTAVVVLPPFALLLTRLLGRSKAAGADGRERARTATAAARGLSNLPG